MKLKETLNLGKTAFPMRAGLPNKEPKWQKEWEEAEQIPEASEFSESTTEGESEEMPESEEALNSEKSQDSMETEEEEERIFNPESVPSTPTVEELLAKCSERIELKTDDTRKACSVLEDMGIEKYKVVDADTIQIFERLNDGGDITMRLAENGVKTMGITVKNEALEDYYLNLTRGIVNV